jgi:hypothetical protein
VAFILSSFEVDDYDAWKQLFDSDPGGRKQAGSGHRLFRGVANPNEVFVSTEFPSAEEAESFRKRLLASGVLDNMTVKIGPTVAELVEETRY